MIDDIYNIPSEISIDDKKYQIEYDNNAYALAEKATGKGLFKIFNLFIENNLPYNDCVEIVCAGLVKHHSKNEIELVKERLVNSPSLAVVNLDNIQLAFAKPLIPPDIVKKHADKSKKSASKKKTVKK